MWCCELREKVICVLAFLAQCMSQGLTLVTERPMRCSYQTAYRMLGAQCPGLNLHNVPTSLKASIEILDASFNRIRDLRNTTFQRYTSLRFLYLGDNMIQNIEAGAFEPLIYLETLDLSLNALTTIPGSIFNMPSLRKLYISHNALTNLNSDLKLIEKPIKTPLEYLNIASCHLTEMPDFGLIPSLSHLNVSSNQFQILSPRNFAQFCGLTDLDLSGSLDGQNICTFNLLAQWFIEQHVRVVPEINTLFNNDSEELRKCTDVQIEEDIKAYEECRLTVKTKKSEKIARKTWTIIIASLAVVLVCFTLCLYWLHRRNVKQTNKKKEAKNIFQVPNTAILLDNIS